jgi:hypothetical protein
MLNIDDLFKNSLKLLKNTRSLDLTAELEYMSRVAFLNMSRYFANRNEKRKEELKTFNMSYCRYFVTCAAAAHLKGDEKYKNLYLSLSRQLNEIDE